MHQSKLYYKVKKQIAKKPKSILQFYLYIIRPRIANTEAIIKLQIRISTLKD